MFQNEQEPLSLLIEITPKLAKKRYRQSIYEAWNHQCGYCGEKATSLDHIIPISKGGESITSNCVPCCLSCNGKKSDSEVLNWYRNQKFYDPRRSMAIRAWFNDDLKLAKVLLNYLN